MILAAFLSLLTVSPEQNGICAAYRAGARELAIGKRPFVNRDYSAAYRQYSHALKLIDRAYEKSFDARVFDDTSLQLSVATGEVQKGRLKAAANLEREALSRRLATIDNYGRCSR